MVDLGHNITIAMSRTRLGIHIFPSQQNQFCDIDKEPTMYSHPSKHKPHQSLGSKYFHIQTVNINKMQRGLKSHHFLPGR